MVRAEGLHCFACWLPFRVVARWHFSSMNLALVALLLDVMRATVIKRMRGWRGSEGITGYGLPKKCCWDLLEISSKSVLAASEQLLSKQTGWYRLHHRIWITFQKRVRLGFLGHANQPTKFLMHSVSSSQLSHWKSTKKESSSNYFAVA